MITRSSFSGHLRVNFTHEIQIRKSMMADKGFLGDRIGRKFGAYAVRTRYERSADAVRTIHLSAGGAGKSSN
jgi:hypothetical protein